MLLLAVSQNSELSRDVMLAETSRELIREWQTQYVAFGNVRHVARHRHVDCESETLGDMETLTSFSFKAWITQAHGLELHFYGTP